MRVLAVDPGKGGAIAQLATGRPPIVIPIPLVRSPKGKDEYDVFELVGVLKSMKRFDEVQVIVERQQALPATLGGTLANYSRGYALGIFEGILTALGLPYMVVTPRRWQGQMLEGIPGEDTKQKAILAAQRLYPQVSLLRTERSRKPDHGFADALLIATWGWRKVMGGAAVLVLALTLSGCATLQRKPGAGPCTTTACGDTCCPDDGKVCPPCWVGIQGGRP